jgi:hypothetical protein
VRCCSTRAQVRHAALVVFPLVSKSTVFMGNALRTSAGVCTSPTVLAGICYDGRTQLKVVQGTLNVVKCRDTNARCHVARVCQDFLNQNHIRVLPLPALSPDLSPIEHLWDDLGRRVRHRLTNNAISKNFSTSLSEKIMDRHKLSCNMKVCGVQKCVCPYGLGWNLSWWSHSAQNCSRNIECRNI